MDLSLCDVPGQGKDACIIPMQRAVEQSNNIQLHNFIKVIIVGGRRKN